MIQCALHDTAAEFSDPRSSLALLPLVWTLQLRPDWVVFEQVPDVRPLWEACAHRLKQVGYTTFVRVLNAADYGVPQSRRRAILIARRQGFAVLPVNVAPATIRSTIRPDRVEWLEQLGWLQRSNGSVGGELGTRVERGLDDVSVTITRKPFRWAAPIALGRPWGEGVRSDMDDATRLQTFPVDYPWQGGVVDQRLQVGNAVPPVFASVLLRAAAFDVDLMEG